MSRFLASVCLMAAALVSHAAGVGLISDVRGRAVLDGNPQRPADLLTELGAGAQLRLDPEARITVLYLATGDEYILKGPGRFQVNKDGPTAIEGNVPEQRRLSVQALQPPKARTSSVAQATLVMRSASPIISPRLLSPSATKIATAAPVFRWEPVAGAVMYRFQLVDADGRTVAAAETGDTETALPPSLRLQTGAPYSWSVEVRLPGDRKRVSRTEFAVLDAEEMVRLERARPGSKATFSERVAYALLLESLDLREEAIASWRTLAAERPEADLLRRLAER